MVAVLAALEHRERTGEGQFIDLAQGEATLQRAAEPLMDYLMNGRTAGPQGNRERGIAPHGAYPCAGEDEWIAIAARTDAEWDALLAAAREDGAAAALADPRWQRGLTRLKAQDELDAAVSEWTRTQGAAELAERLQAAGVPAARFCGPEHLLIEEDFTTLCTAGIDLSAEAATPIRGALYIGAPWKFPRTPAAITAPVANRGEHDDYVFNELLQIPPAELADLRDAGIL